MPWPLKFVRVGQRCEACKATWEFAPTYDEKRTCPNGCTAFPSGLVSRMVDLDTAEPPRVGDAYYDPRRLTAPGYRAELAPLYWQQNAHRPPIVVMLPGGSPWCVDTYAYDGERGPHGQGWTVTGDIRPGRPTLGSSPSINMVGRYHGYVTDGVITNDCEGRQFSVDGATCL